MKKHKILLDMINDFMKFSSKYYIYLIFSIPPKPNETKTISETKHKDIILNCISKKGQIRV